ncbi:SDR family NAD(P)-dependent oxidoreductase [Nocardia africana]|uniref:Pyridoxal 4-dehydrogenase n=1 Tax=Nocardia africana TaxID=134964 RepID=A0A378WUA1_9NOCA|nr:SDR family NAD(P)-dependent oxidoreductase [Nocardia africana]MCC3313707.1 SDR family NAD(P)-dependent oxidoreductase [Nocardia africana]SUA44910.1 Pyridoxal 4-dehydrogenase [Nocardia africana]
MSEYSSAPRTVLVTGVDDRLGYATAQQLVADGDTVLMLPLDEVRGEQAKAQLIADGADRRRLRMAHADFSRLSEVAALATQLADTLPALDALINAASIPAPHGRTHTEDGHELTFQVNYLAPWTLTMALAPAIAAARGRVLNVTSRLHLGGNIDYSDLDRRHGYYTPLAIYAQSKLAMTMFTRSLAETGPAGLTAIAVDPCDFEIDLPQLRSHAVESLASAAVLLTALSNRNIPVVNGGYYECERPAAPASQVRNSRAWSRLSAWTNGLTRAA